MPMRALSCLNGLLCLSTLYRPKIFSGLWCGPGSSFPLSFHVVWKFSLLTPAHTLLILLQVFAPINPLHVFSHLVSTFQTRIILRPAFCIIFQSLPMGLSPAIQCASELIIYSLLATYFPLSLAFYLPISFAPSNKPLEFKTLSLGKFIRRQVL